MEATTFLILSFKLKKREISLSQTAYIYNLDLMKRRIYKRTNNIFMRGNGG